MSPTTRWSASTLFIFIILCLCAWTFTGCAKDLKIDALKFSCEDDSECPNGKVCTSNPEEEGVKFCASLEEIIPLKDGEACAPDQFCEGKCKADICYSPGSSCFDDLHCIGELICDIEKSSCIEKPLLVDGERCIGSEFCEGERECEAGICYSPGMNCFNDQHCPEGLVCDVEKSSCIEEPFKDGEECGSNEQCEGESVCGAGICYSPNISCFHPDHCPDSTCDIQEHTCGECNNATAPCDASEYCSGGACSSKILGGEACSADLACVSNECIEGFCCLYEGLCCADGSDCSERYEGCHPDKFYCYFSPVMLPDTGQTLCYDNMNTITCNNSVFPNQDGDLRSPLDERFTLVDANGIILDNVTGLEWSVASPLVEAGTEKPTGVNAESSCNASILGGAGGNLPAIKWRVPKRYELQGIVDYGQNTAPFLSSKFGAEVSSSLIYWTSTIDRSEDGRYWTVNFSNGQVKSELATEDKFLLRCVRP